MIRPHPAVEALPPATPFIGPERLMRETGRSELVRLGANESAFGPSPFAIAAMERELPRLSWYGDPDSLDLRDALASKHACDAGSILVVAGIDDVMGLIVRAYVGAGGLALAARGTYPTFAYHVHGYGGTLETVDYRDDGFVDVDAMIAAARRLDPHLVYLANPDNPSGTLLPASEVERLIDALPARTLLLLDEAYADFVSDDRLLARPLDDRVIRTRTFSKAYGFAGARIGYALLTRAHHDVLQKVRLQYGVNRNAQIGALAALADTAFVTGVIAQTQAGREEYVALATSLGLRTLPSHTNFVCIDCGTGERATRVMHELLQRGVWIRKPGARPLDRFVRVSVGTAPMRAAFTDAFRAVLAVVPA